MRQASLEPVTTSHADAMLNALPIPLIMVAQDGRIVDANVAAEQFFESSATMLRRYQLRELVPFGSPLLALVDQARRHGAPVNEYKVDLSTPRNPGDRLVDLHVAPMPEMSGHVVVSIASTSACRPTSASECPDKPRGCGIATPPMVT